MAINLSQYNEFPEGTDFSSILAKRGVARVRDTLDKEEVIVPSSEAEEEDMDMGPAPTPDSARDAAEVQDDMQMDFDDQEIAPDNSPRKSVLSTPSKARFTYQSSSKRSRRALSLDREGQETQQAPLLSPQDNRPTSINRRSRRSSARQEAESDVEAEDAPSSTRRVSRRNAKSGGDLSPPRSSSRRKPRSASDLDDEEEPVVTDGDDDEPSTVSRRSSRKSKGNRKALISPKKERASDDIEMRYASSDSDLEPPSAIAGGKALKKQKSVFDGVQIVTPRRQGTARDSSFTMTGVEGLGLPSSPKKSVKKSSGSTSADRERILAKASSSTHHVSSSTASTPDPETVSAGTQRARRTAATSAETKLKASMADANRFQEELRRKNFNRIGSTPDDYVGSSTSANTKKRKPKVESPSEDEGESSAVTVTQKRRKTESSGPSKTQSRKPVKEEAGSMSVLLSAVSISVHADSSCSRKIFLVHSGFRNSMDKLWPVSSYLLASQRQCLILSLESYQVWCKGQGSAAGLHTPHTSRIFSHR